LKEEKQKKAAKIIGTVLFVTLVMSVIYAFIRFLLAPSEIPVGEPYRKIKTDYLLMITQCVLGLLVMMLPTFIARKWKIVVPNTIVIVYFVFLYCAIYLGEVRNFYYTIPHWDTILHAFSGAMLGALGFVLVDILNKDSKVAVDLSPFFVAAFAFCFALAVGALWEVYEFSFDAVLGLNMQKHTTESGVALVGKTALSDTMKDIIIDALAALVVSVLGYILNKRRYNK
jgi:uncharacterized membrane protein YjdF